MSNEALEVTDQELVHLIATDPHQMADAQSHLKKFLSAKVREMKVELHDVQVSHQVAVQNNWGSATLKRQLERGQERLLFYEKALAAVIAGYTIIPNFPISVFAVRVNKNAPRQVAMESSYSSASASRSVPDEKGKALPVGEGRYVSPSQLIHVETDKIPDGKGQETTRYLAWPVEFSKVVFPINIARPQVMEAASEANAEERTDCGGEGLERAAGGCDEEAWQDGVLASRHPHQPVKHGKGQGGDQRCRRHTRRSGSCACGSGQFRVFGCRRGGVNK